MSAFQAVSNHILLLTHACAHRGGTTAAPTPAVLKRRNQTTEPCQCVIAHRNIASRVRQEIHGSVCATSVLSGESGRHWPKARAACARFRRVHDRATECTTAQAQVRADTGFHNELWWCSLLSPTSSTPCRGVRSQAMCPGAWERERYMWLCSRQGYGMNNVEGKSKISCLSLGLSRFICLHNDQRASAL